ncbi:hypothetical protein L5515_000800 [Caenorhabditis briggsae]|uniref:LITAF domain-containing protein n=1 Tax=Caenorhabditis briggsae TaxID=6238 RepID=A0AAE9E1M7_CAEBR|nr:hypothetical protein L5515_000800 [Caenorhabditis briggsae]
MTINPVECLPQEYEEAPLTPRNDGKVQFLGPETVRYISPPRIEVVRQRVRPIAPQPPQTAAYSSISPPPSYQSSLYPTAIPPQPQVVPISMPMMSPQYMMPQMAPMITHQPQMMCMPTIQQPVIAAPVAQMAQMLAPVQLSPPQFVQAPQQQTSPAVTLCINQSPQVGGISGGNGNALVCPKCRKGIITRQQDKLRKKILLCLAFCCCPLTCGIPLFWICCNYVDTCGACGKSYGHRGKKNYKKKVNAVTM